MKKKHRSHGLYRPRFRKNDHTHNMQVEVLRWVKANGGSAVVIGGVGLMQESPFNYFVCVKCTGVKPEKPKAEKQ